MLVKTLKSRFKEIKINAAQDFGEELKASFARLRKNCPCANTHSGARGIAVVASLAALFAALPISAHATGTAAGLIDEWGCVCSDAELGCSSSVTEMVTRLLRRIIMKNKWN